MDEIQDGIIKHRIIVKVYVDLTRNFVFIGKVRCRKQYNENAIIRCVKEELVT